MTVASMAQISLMLHSKIHENTLEFKSVMEV